eukprot:1726396-Prymnesium_polylepis.1
MERADFFVNHVLEERYWRAAEDATRTLHLAELRTHYEDIKARSVTLRDGSQQTFGDFFSSAALFLSVVPSAELRWLTVRELLDPEVALHRNFFAERLPAPDLCTEANLAWLRRAGMSETLTRAGLYEAALQVHEQAEQHVADARPISRSVVEQAEQLFDALVSAYGRLSESGEPDDLPIE